MRERAINIIHGVLTDEITHYDMEPATARRILLRITRLMKLDLKDEVKENGVAHLATMMGVSRSTAYRLTKAAVFILFFFLPTLLMAQGARIDNTAWATNPYVLAGASVSVCPDNSGQTFTIATAPTGATESGPLVTITIASGTLPAGFVTGAWVATSGVGVGAYNGTNQIVSATTTSFSYISVITGLATSGSGTASLSLPPPGFSCGPVNAAIFSDAKLSQSVVNPTTSDILGNYGFYVAVGNYQVSIGASGSTTRTNAVTIGCTLTGTCAQTGSVSITNPCAIAGTIYVTVGGCYTTLAQAFAACAAPNCTINMLGASGAAATTLGTFDPGTAFPVTIYLGSYTYSLTQMVTRTGLHVVGMGTNATFINQAVAGTAPFVLPAAGGTYPANVAIHVLFKGFNLNAAVSSTTDGFSMVANKDVAGLGGGIWYSRWEDINIGSNAFFGRNPIRLETATQNLTASLNGANQFLSFQDVFAFRQKNNTNPALMITGSYNGQISFDNCEFDGQLTNLDTVANVYNIRIDDGGDNWVPYSIHMRNVTSQGAGGIGSAAIFLGGLTSFDCDVCHFEGLTGIIKEALGAGGHGNWGIMIQNAYTSNNVGVSAGNGFWANLDVNSQLDFSNNAIGGTPDNYFTGSQAFLVIRPNFNNFAGGLQPQPAQIPNQFTAKRFAASNAATNLTTGNFALTGNWGTGPSLTSVTGTDSSFILLFSVGTGSPGANPGVNLTFADGGFKNSAGTAIIPVCTMNDNSPNHFVQSNVTSSTLLSMVYLGTPAASGAIQVNVICNGKQN